MHCLLHKYVYVWPPIHIQALCVLVVCVRVWRLPYRVQLLCCPCEGHCIIDTTPLFAFLLHLYILLLLALSLSLNSYSNNIINDRLAVIDEKWTYDILCWIVHWSLLLVKGMFSYCLFKLCIPLLRAVASQLQHRALQSDLDSLSSFLNGRRILVV